MRTCNITQIYVYKDDPLLGISSASAFIILSTKDGLKCYSPGQLVFGRDIILLIKYMVDWELIRQGKQTQINKYNIRKNRKQVDHDYKVGDKIMLNNHAAYKYKTPYKGPFFITRCWANGAIRIQYDLIQIRHNIRRIEPYKYDTNVEDIKPKNMCDYVNI